VEFPARIGRPALQGYCFKGVSMASLLRDRRAVTALEYCLISMLVAIAIVTSVGLVGTNLGTQFTLVAGKI
jgi:pilus assembly protein Flp/PilA